MAGQGVIWRTHVFGFIVFMVYSHVSKHQRGQGDHHDQHPHAHDHPPHHLPADPVQFPWKQHGHHPVHAHQRDEKDGGVHVGVAQVEEAFTHEVPKDPRLLGQVDDEEDGESHEGAIGAGQVEDQDGGDRAVPDAGQDAPDDEEVTGDAQEDDDAEDEGAQGGGEVAAHNGFFLNVRSI